MENSSSIYEAGAMQEAPAERLRTRRAKPESKQGITPYKTKDGTRYLAQIRLAGHKPERQSFESFALAKAWREKRQTELRDGKNRQSLVPAGMMLCGDDGLFAIYIRDAKKDRGGIELPHGQRLLFARMGRHPVLQGVKVSDVDYALMREYCRARRAEGVQPATIQSEYSRIAVAIERMSDWYEWEGFHPMHNVRRRLMKAGLIADSNERCLRPTKKQLKDLRDYLSERQANPRERGEQPMPVADMIAVAALQGFRLSEFLKRMEWENLDIEHGTIGMWRKDSGGELQADGYHRSWREVPLVPAALEIILRQQPDPAKRKGLVFPYNSSTVQGKWEDARKAIGAPGLRIHDLRHEASTTLAMTLPEQKAMAFTGHKTSRSFKRYTNFQKEDYKRMSSECASISLD